MDRFACICAAGGAVLSVVLESGPKLKQFFLSELGVSLSELGAPNGQGTMCEQVGNVRGRVSGADTV